MVAASKRAEGTPARSVASPSLYSTLAAGLASAARSISAEKSTPRTEPAGPTLLARARVRLPVPQARSMAESPGRGPGARATGRGPRAPGQGGGEAAGAAGGVDGRIAGAEARRADHAAVPELVEADGHHGVQELVAARDPVEHVPHEAGPLLAGGKAVGGGSPAFRQRPHATPRRRLESSAASVQFPRRRSRRAARPGAASRSRP